MPGNPSKWRRDAAPDRVPDESETAHHFEEPPEVTGSDEDQDVADPGPLPSGRRPPETHVPKSRLYLSLTSVAARSSSRACGNSTMLSRAAQGVAAPRGQPGLGRSAASTIFGGQDPPWFRRVAPPPPKPRRVLKLTDDEILGIYRSAQTEAGMEADWYGIQGPKSCLGPAAAAPDAGVGSSPDAVVDSPISRLALSCTSSGTFASQCSPAKPPAPGGYPAAAEANSSEMQDIKQECLRILSRALQQPGPGQSPSSLAAEITNPQPDIVCCSSPPKVRLGSGSHRCEV